ncbi:MAG: hypothetical protein K2M11_03690 [Paramuribaculum sp.]|nr:hypothetical protein [Paramuribaculum sp.]
MKKNTLKKIKILSRILIGYYKRFLIDFGLVKIRHLPVKDNTPQVVVSLTSYGRRVKSVVYYTLISILAQEILPNKIVLWLDNNNWTIDNLPDKLKHLRSYGVEFRFCKDIKSYKKLIPTIALHPNDLIITIDDDIIYNKDLIGSLLFLHSQFPHNIITSGARYPLLKNENQFTAYNRWHTSESYEEKPLYIMPYGGSGTLYPPASLHEDATDSDLAQQLCPTADDIWFWIMAKRVGTSHKVVNNNLEFGYAFDDLYQYLHRGSALTHSNSKQNHNDTQLQGILDHYKLNLSELRQNS